MHKVNPLTKSIHEAALIFYQAFILILVLCTPSLSLRAEIQPIDVLGDFQHNPGIYGTPYLGPREMMKTHIFDISSSSWQFGKTLVYDNDYGPNAYTGEFWTEYGNCSITLTEYGKEPFSAYNHPSDYFLYDVVLEMYFEKPKEYDPGFVTMHVILEGQIKLNWVYREIPTLDRAGYEIYYSLLQYSFVERENLLCGDLWKYWWYDDGLECAPWPLVEETRYSLAQLKDGTVVFAVEFPVSTFFDLVNATAYFYFPVAPNTIMEPKGIIKGQILPDPSLQFLDEIGVQRAKVYVIEQPGYVKVERLPGESENEFEERLAAIRRLPPVDNDNLEPDDSGHYQFQNLPIYKTVSEAGVASFKPVYYTVLVLNGNSDVEVTETDPNTNETVTRIEKSYFESMALFNVLADGTIPFNESNFVLNLLTPVDSKFVVVNELSAEPTKNNYKAIEDEVVTYLNQVLAKPEGLSDKELEGITRAVLAEYAVRDGAYFADGLLNLMLKALGTVATDAYDELVGLYYSKKSLLARKTKETQDKLSSEKRIIWSLSPDASENQRKLEQNLNRLKLRKEDADFVDDVLINSIKILRSLFQYLLNESGVFDAKTVEDIASKVEKSMIVALKTIKGGAVDGFSRPGNLAKGGLLKAGAALIPKLVEQMKPVLLDGSDAFSYTGITAPTLAISAKKLKEWNSNGPDPDFEKYTTDQANVSRELNEMNQEATNHAINALYLLGLGEGLDNSETWAGLLKNIPKLKWVEAWEKTAKVSKFIANGAAVAEPLATTYSYIPKQVSDAVHYAYGEIPPATIPKPVPNSGYSQLEYTPQPASAAANLEYANTISLEIDKLQNILNQLRSHLENNDIGAALDLTGSENPPNYTDSNNRLNQLLSTFLTQAQGADVPLTDFMTKRIDLNMVEADFTDRLSDLYYNIMAANYKDPQDALYLAERDRVLESIVKLSFKLNLINEVVNDLNSSIAGMDLKPAIVIESITLDSGGTEVDSITQTPQDFTLRGHVRNISDVPVSGLSVKLSVASSRDSLSANPAADSPIQILSLAADDNVEGSGEDEVEVTWQINYNGDLQTEIIFLSLEILENGAEPVNIVADGNSIILTIDPSVDDKDLDLIPDKLELQYGLSDTTDDALLDKDSDGLSNYYEIVILGTNPQLADTDEDGLTDGEELTGGIDGYVTNPLDPDTDGDGVPDNLDGQPVDAGSIVGPPEEDKAGEPVVVVDKHDVTLTSENSIAVISVTNGGNGAFNWTSIIENDAIAMVSPESPEMNSDNGYLIISAPSSLDWNFSDILETKVYVRDLTGATKDIETINVKVYGDNVVTWAGYVVDDITGDVDTSDWMGLCNVKLTPWIYNYASESWIFCPEIHVTKSGTWIYIHDLKEKTPELWLLKVPGTQWGYSWGLQKWMFLTESGWVYLL